MYIHVIVHSRSNREEIVETKTGYYDIWVREPAERGLANKKVVELIRHHLNCTGRISIINGHHHPKKLISIED